ncbi:basic helix-loop-helix protein [Mortierella alpina]|nr:basic helix-loop-helix protein [Mortierella alpina]
MESNQEVQDVIKNLTNTISAVGDSLSFQAVIEQHTRAVAESKPSSEAGTSEAAAGPISVDTSHFDEQQQRDHEELQRIAEQHQHEIQQQHETQEKQTQERQELEAAEPAQDHASVSAADNQDEEHQQVLQHIANATAAAGAAEAADAVSTLATVPIAESPPTSTAKLVPGSDEWHRVRRDNHKEVERRRRETINAGINDLAALIPNSEKNKGSILKQAVRYITSIQADIERLNNEANHMEAATAATRELEKALLDKALVEKSVAEGSCISLLAQHEQLKIEYENLQKKMNELSEEHASKKQRTE